MPTALKRTRALAPAPRKSLRGPLNDTLTFMRLLWAVDHRLRALSKQMHASIGITGPQRLVLRLIGRYPEVTPSELADLLHLDRGTLTGVLGRLMSQRLLVRTPHPDDGRSVLLRLSARGRTLDRDAPGTVEACVRRALASLPRGKVEAARQVLEALAYELDAEEQRQLARKGVAG
jgi:MarR family transcriptional regulator, organic hydroperoxide resistance regulator